MPTGSDDAFINNGGIADITSTTGAAAVNKLRLGAGLGNSGTLNIATGGAPSRY